MGTPSLTGTCATEGPAFAGGATDGPPREGRATPPRDGRATVVGMLKSDTSREVEVTHASDARRTRFVARRSNNFIAGLDR